MGEAFLGFLAIVAVALTLIPMLFNAKPQTDALIEGAQWVIIGVFAIEYLLALSFTTAKRAFLLNPWRWVDLATIVVPLLTLLPGISDALRSTPVLRLVRLVRLFTLGVRASGVMVRGEARGEAVSLSRPVEISVLRAQQAKTPEHTSWDEFLRWVRSPGQEWYNVSNVGVNEAHKIALAAGIAPAFIETHLLSASYPHFECTDRYAAIFLWLPELSPTGQHERNGLLLLATENSLLTLSRRPTKLIQTLIDMPLQAETAKLPFPTRMTCVLLQAIIKRNEELVGHFERELRTLEDLPVRESRPQFFELTFRLKKELSATQSDLWRFKSILGDLAEGRSRLPAGGAGEADFLRRLANTAEYLYETVVNTREGLLSLIELHLNVVSFDINRIMRVLAVVSVLGLIPGVVGGLFGMNLADNPWPFTLPQVAFMICFAMVLCFYFFFVKGWLR
jgi:Mg2+ and Co2+ transporter CorA